MILGTGIDIIEVSRIRASYEKFGERFLKRILRPGEIAYCLSHRHPAPFLAARFAAKEAISKAFGTGIRTTPRVAGHGDRAQRVGSTVCDSARRRESHFAKAQRTNSTFEFEPHGELRGRGGGSGG